MRGGGKSIRIDSRCTEAYGPHEVMLHKEEINTYTKTKTWRAKFIWVERNSK